MTYQTARPSGTFGNSGQAVFRFIEELGKRNLIINEGKIVDASFIEVSIQRNMKEVNNGYECGLTVKGFSDLAVNDSIITYEQEEVKRTL